MSIPHPLVAELAALAPLKTWSLIVTLFGDVQEDRIFGRHIRDLLGHIDIKPEAIRVAMHRLKNDHWIVSEKQGRDAAYGLSVQGQKETAAASQDVYRSDIKFRGGWSLVLLDPERVKDGATARFEVPVSRDVVLCPKDMVQQTDVAFASETDVFPTWFENRLVSDTSIEIAQALVELLERYAHAADALTEQDRSAFRLLVLHHWRRIALRNGSWAHISLQPIGAIATCHRHVTAFLNRGPRLGFS